MKRIPTTLAAVAAAAVVAAAITIPAVAQSGGGGSAPDPALARFTACLTAHGVDVPAGLGGVELKQWIGARQDDATIRAAQQACGAARPEMEGHDVSRLASCLRGHGVDVGSSPLAIKQKVAELGQTDAGKATLSACGIQIADKPGAGGGGCGGKAAPAPDDQPSEVPKQEGT